MWEVMFWPIVACVLLPWLLVYLGLHVVQRGIIFIDIAMAQMASLGICVAVLFHLNLESPATFAIALGFTLLGAAIFSVTGKRASQVPQEAVIGIAYVVAAAAAVLLLSRAAEGDEQIKQMLVGNILLVTPLEVWKCFGLFAIVGLLHFVLRRNFLLVSFDRDGAYEKGLRVRWWDFLFYAAFGLVVTSFVRIAGVLLVFSYLIVPAVCGINLAGSLGRTALDWLAHRLARRRRRAFLFVLVGLPSGAAIVCTFGALLIIVSLISLLRPKSPRRALRFEHMRVIPSCARPRSRPREKRPTRRRSPFRDHSTRHLERGHVMCERNLRLRGHLARLRSSG